MGDINNGIEIAAQEWAEYLAWYEEWKTLSDEERDRRVAKGRAILDEMCGTAALDE